MACMRDRHTHQPSPNTRQNNPENQSISAAGMPPFEISDSRRSTEHPNPASEHQPPKALAMLPAASPLRGPSTMLSMQRRASHGFGGSITGRKKRTPHLYERMGPDGRVLPQFKSKFASAPKLESAYDMPSDLPPVPLHIEELTQRRLNWYERTMQDDKLSQDDLDVLKKAMDRYRKPERRTVDFARNQKGPSMDRMTFFEDPEMAVVGSVGEGEEIPGIEVGRVVEIRRSGASFTGLVLAPILVAGRPRILLLRNTGEIWPVSPNDVQFVMPASLVSAEDAEACWHPDLLKLWADGEDIGLSSGEEEESSLLGKEKTEAMAAARRKVATILRRVQRETERMEARLTGGTLKTGRGGGIEAVWDMFVPEDPEARGSVTSSEVAEHLLNAEGAGEGGTKRIIVRPATLPAFAAHSLLMRRPDLFLADDREMWSSGTFLVRSRRERDRYAEVARLVETGDPALKAFVDKATSVGEKLGKGETAPEWTEQELDIISVLLMPFYEQRSTQKQFTASAVAAITKLFNVKEAKTGVATRIDAGVISEVMTDIGVLPPTDSIRTSRFNEAIKRSYVMSSVIQDTGSATSEPTKADAALDSLRSDLSHRVYVIDDAAAEELDDGVAVERISDNDFWIHVHVADPTRFIDRDGALATHSSLYGTSVYLPEGTVPLLPSKIGGGSASLGATHDTRGQGTMVFSARVDRAGNINDYKVSLGLIKDAVVTTYAAVNEALGIDPGHTNNPFGYFARDRLSPSSQDSERSHATLSEKDVEDLQLLRELTDALRTKRYANAGIEWWTVNNASDIKVLNSTVIPNIFDRSHIPTTPTAYPSPAYKYTVSPAPPVTTSNSLVAEIMVLANRTAAHFCATNSIPAPFRGMAAPRNTTSTPSHLTVEKLLASRTKGSGVIDAYDLQLSNVLFPSVTLDTRPSPFWTMGFDANDHGYLRATSPLRRYDDMLVHWQIKAALGRSAGIQTSLLDASEVMALAKRSDAAQHRAKSAQNQAKLFWQAGLLSSRLAGETEGYVYGSNDKPVNLTAPLRARAIGLTVTSGLTVRTPVAVESIGITADLEEELPIGEEVDVVIKEVRKWPNPLFHAVSA